MQAYLDIRTFSRIDHDQELERIFSGFCHARTLDLPGYGRRYPFWKIGIRNRLEGLRLDGYGKDFIFNPCEYCLGVPADGYCKAYDAHICAACFEDHHGPVI